jgi:hypothetical protein
MSRQRSSIQHLDFTQALISPGACLQSVASSKVTPSLSYEAAAMQGPEDRARTATTSRTAEPAVWLGRFRKFDRP